MLKPHMHRVQNNSQLLANFNHIIAHFLFGHLHAAVTADYNQLTQSVTNIILSSWVSPMLLYV